MGQAMTEDGPGPEAPHPLAAARADYENPATDLKAIAARFGIGVSALVRHARLSGWRLRGRKKDTAARRQKRETARQTIARLRDLVQRRLTQLESQLDAIGEDVAAIASERDLRAMNTLVRTLEKVLELERDERRRRSTARTHARQFDDAGREELARRLAALHRQWQAEEAGAAPAQPGGDGSQP
jgi:phage-related minor tail protein